MQHLSPHTVRTDRDHLSFFYDSRSGNLAEIQEFLSSQTIERLQQSIQDRTYVVLGGDGLFVAVAKVAHIDNAQILGINFGSKGVLLHDRSVFDREVLEFEQQEYPILHVDVEIGDVHVHGHAFNEFRIEREPTASSLRLSLSHRNKELSSFAADGVMISTPAGSTWWSLNYGGIPLNHYSGQNLITPFGNRSLHPTIVPDKGRIRIKNDATRYNPLYILADGVPILRDEDRAIEIVIDRAERWVVLLIESSYRGEWDKKPYRELGFS